MAKRKEKPKYSGEYQVTLIVEAYWDEWNNGWRYRLSIADAAGDAFYEEDGVPQVHLDSLLDPEYKEKLLEQAIADAEESLAAIRKQLEELKQEQEKLNNG